MKFKVTGFDPSLRNWGIAYGTYDTETKQLTIEEVRVVCPVLVKKSKTVKQNSLDVLASKQLFTVAFRYAEQSHIIFAEIPIGSQSSRAMCSYGVCSGILGAISAIYRPVVELTPRQVKEASVGNPEATKEAMVAWAVSKHPEANWPMHNLKGKQVVTTSKAEHMADAVATIYAGLKLPDIQTKIGQL
jgi:Holliday junction resolvasome RuvABC endonuclease subunit